MHYSSFVRWDLLSTFHCVLSEALGLKMYAMGCYCCWDASVGAALLVI